MARVPVAASSRRSPGKPGIAGIIMMIRKGRFSSWARWMAVTREAPIVFAIGGWDSPVAVTDGIRKWVKRESRVGTY